MLLGKPTVPSLLLPKLVSHQDAILPPADVLAIPGTSSSYSTEVESSSIVLERNVDMPATSVSCTVMEHEEISPGEQRV